MTLLSPTGLLTRVVLPVALALLLAAAWHTMRDPGSAKVPDGRYHSAGQVQLSDGRVIQTSHNIRFRNGRFYAMSRQGDTLLESSGLLEFDDGRYVMHVDHGEVTRLTPELDTELVFNLLYSRLRGASITLHPVGDCLYARESLQFFCPGQSESPAL
ncbi:hypothetical protein SAMN05216421_3243 [Halopseudomonas xinjiangensis]|uniref:Uncharacterized protein n=2 Tax=Halopseudomonas xinjiangensis TaxID=487184 RepID=A0A1H1YR32_9GAMM|nr:hypothetical protein SAMN05216421_3243 [Halopseudomonas xinjiangensis]